MQSIEQQYELNDFKELKFCTGSTFTASARNLMQRASSKP